MADLYAGVDLGGTNITCCLATADGEIIASCTEPTNSAAGPQAVLDHIAYMIEKLTSENATAPAALAMGVPGLVDIKNCVTKFLPNFPTQWPDIEVGKVLNGRLGCDIYILNDVRTATLGELRFGRGRDVDSMAFFALGTGVGGGVVIDGKLRLGPLGAAGELGHQTIIPGGAICGCGHRGCLETLASGPAITAAGVRLLLSGLAPALGEITGGDIARVTPQTMAQAAAAGDKNVRDAIYTAADYLGFGIANVITILHPQLVVLGGGVAEMGDLLINRVAEKARASVGMFPTDDVRIEKSALGTKAGIMGAIALASAGGNV